MAKTPHYPLSFSFIFSFVLLHFCLLLQALQNPDTQPLLAFKQSSDPSNIKLTTWSHTTDPCSWYGVSCLHNRVTRLVLEDMDLHGDLNSLNSLTQLRVMSLNRNHFSGPLPNLSNLTSLKLLFLSSNNFSGEFPPSLTTLFRLYRLDLSGNKFSGKIPATLNRLTHLLTLRLEENKFSGDISELNLVNLEDFNVSGNKLGGQIPKCLANFPKAAFDRNLIFCGDPMDKKCDVNERSGLDKAIASSSVDKPTTVASPSIKSGNKSSGSSSSRISSLAIISIIVGDILVLIVLSLLLYCYFWRNYTTGRGGGNNNSSCGSRGRGEVGKVEKLAYGSGNSGLERGKMVFLDGAGRFELEDLLRASAEMLGKGGFGTAYKAVLEDGNVVAVKRLKEVGGNVGGGKREFEQQMEVLGKLRHPNLVSLTAYYFAKDEKLLVYEYMPNGNLFSLLHGNRGPGRIPLDWTTRLKIAAGAARGLVFIHNSCKPLNLTHGNIKSTNILLDKSSSARVSDFGLSFALTSSVTPRTNGYRAPESPIDNARKLTQKSDVYSFGVLLLELLTGKCPSSAADDGGYGSGGGGIVDLPRWVQSVVREEWTAEVFDLELLRYKDIEEEMVGLLQIAMMCTSIAPDKRPTMSFVLKMIEEIRGVEVSPSYDSVSDSPAVSDGPAN